MRRSLWDLKVMAGLLVFMLICLVGCLLFPEDVNSVARDSGILLRFAPDTGVVAEMFTIGTEIEIRIGTEIGDCTVLGQVGEEYVVTVDENGNVVLEWVWADISGPPPHIVPTRTPTVVQPYPLPPTLGPTSLPVVYPMARPRR